MLEDSQARILNVLRIVTKIDVCSAPYNQFSLAWASQQNITICTYFPSDQAAFKHISLIAGDGTVPGFFRALKSALDKNKYDVIHVHVPSDGVLFIIASLFMGPKLLRSTICTVHNVYLGFDVKNRFLLAWVLVFFRRIISCGLASYASFPGIFKWLGGKRFNAIQNGVDIDRVDRTIGKNGFRSNHNSFTTVTIGRLIELKNPAVVLNAFHQSKDQESQLIYIGQGHLQSSLAAASSKLGLDEWVKMTGLIPREAVYEYLANADLFVSASRIEGLPLAVLEAMACRCPVVLSNIPAHQEIAAGVDFIPLIQADDVTGFAREIRKFCQMPAAEREAIGESCRKLVEERFSLTAMHEKYAQIYLEVAGETRARDCL